jgi:hypothetical protein
MIIAFEDPDYQTIFQSTRAILFMGTPHKGSSKATLGKLFAHIASAVIMPNKELLRTLERDSKVLQDVTFSWKHHYPGLQIASCYELRPTYLKFERLSTQVRRGSLTKGHVTDRAMGLLDCGSSVGPAGVSG